MRTGRLRIRNRGDIRCFWCWWNVETILYYTLMIYVPCTLVKYILNAYEHNITCATETDSKLTP